MTDSPNHLAQVELPDLASALARGYGGSTTVSDQDGGKLCIYYDNPDDAAAAHDALAKAMDAAIRDS